MVSRQASTVPDSSSCSTSSSTEFDANGPSHKTHDDVVDSSGNEGENQEIDVQVASLLSKLRVPRPSDLLHK